MVEAVKHKSERSTPAPTPEVRLAHVWLHEKRTKQASGALLKNPHYSIVLLVPKTSNDAALCKNYAWLAAHCMEAATKAWQGWPPGGKWPIQDGDVPYAQKPVPGKKMLTPEEIVKRNAWRVGSWVVEATNNLDPGPRVAVMQNGQAVDIPAKVIAGVTMYKSGDYGHVSLSAYTFQNETFGVNFGFEGVLFTRPGELIGSAGGPRSTEAMFGGVAPAGAPALGPPAQPGPAPVYAPPAAPPAPVGAYAPPVAPPAPPAPPVPPPPAAPLPPMPPAPPGPR